VNHSGYTVAEDAVQRMCGKDGEQYLRDNIGKPGSLVWVQLGVRVFEGELRVGLAAISAQPSIGERAARDGTEVWVEWITRKSSKRERGKSSVAFKSCFSTADVA
jgi:predicted trehalose synthase